MLNDLKPKPFGKLKQEVVKQIKIFLKKHGYSGKELRFETKKIIVYEHEHGIGIIIPLPSANTDWTNKAIGLYEILRDNFGGFIVWDFTNDKKFPYENQLVVIINARKE